MVHPDFNIASFTFESYLKEKRRKTRTAQNIRFQALPETSPALKTQILADVTLNYETGVKFFKLKVCVGWLKILKRNRTSTINHYFVMFQRLSARRLN